jgi:hypothetical protein
MTTQTPFLEGYPQGVSIKNEMTKIPPTSASLYESVYMLINHIQRFFHKIISMSENEHLFVFVCRKSIGWGGLNMIFKFFITEASFFSNFMNRGRARLNNLNFIMQEKI